MKTQTKKVVEAVLVGGVLVVSMSGVNAQNLCSAGTAGTLATSATSFIKTELAPKCSANTVINVTDSGASFTVAGASQKGNQVYGGSTEGGGITMCTTFGATFPTISASASTGC